MSENQLAHIAKTHEARVQALRGALGREPTWVEIEESQPLSPELAQGPVTLVAARKELQLFGSFGRLPALLRLWPRMERTEALTLLGEAWSICDAPWRHSKDLLRVLPKATQPEMMTSDERAMLADLPERFTIFRGADKGFNEKGLSWSLDRTVAARFPFHRRYRARVPVLVTAMVIRSDVIALKLDRSEAEILARKVQVLSVEEIDRPA